MLGSQGMKEREARACSRRKKKMRKARMQLWVRINQRGRLLGSDPPTIQEEGNIKPAANRSSSSSLQHRSGGP